MAYDGQVERIKQIDNVENNLSIKISALDSKIDKKFNTLISKIEQSIKGNIMSGEEYDNVLHKLFQIERD